MKINHLISFVSSIIILSQMSFTGESIISPNITHAISLPNIQYFDGIDDYQIINETSVTNLSDEFSFSVWVKSTENRLNALTKQREIFFKKGSNLMLGYEYETTEFKTWLRFYVKYEDGSTQEVEYKDMGIKTTRNDEWHQIVVTFKKTENMKMYIDGILVDNEPTHKQGIKLSKESNDYILGARVRNNGDVDRNLEGQINNFQIYNHEISDEQIFAIYQNEKHMIN